MDDRKPPLNASGLSVPTATAETSVVIGAIDGSDPVAVTLFDRAIRGDFNIAATTRLWTELTKSRPSAELHAYLEARTVGAPARYDVSTYGGSDFYPDASDSVAGDDFDGDHVAGHIRSARQFFISRDARQIKRAKAAGVNAVTPDEFLELFPAR